MSVTLKDVAKRAGVSAATASRVVGNYGYVSEETRQRVLAAVQELNYRPNVVARSMVTKSTRTIGMVVTDITNPFFAQLARGVEKVSWEHGYTLILANTDEDIHHEQAIVQVLQDKQVDGLVVVPASSTESSHLLAVVDQNIPLVLADRLVNGCSVDVVMVNNEEGAYEAVCHLASLGHKRIGMILDNLDISTNQERLEGYRKAIRDSGLEVDDHLVRSCQFTHQSAYAIASELVRQNNPPDALFTANNFMTIGAIHAIQEAGLRIPEDIALVGFDDLDWNSLYPPQLTVVAQPVREMGRIAAQRLLARIAEESGPPQQIRLNTEFIIRQSCGAQAQISNTSDHSE